MSLLQSEKLTSQRTSCRHVPGYAIGHRSDAGTTCVHISASARKGATKEASLYLVVSAGLLAILLTASRQSQLA
jgi:hypothetical protein